MNATSSRVESALRIAILTVSDGVSEGWREDTSGDHIEAWARERGYDVVQRRFVADEASLIEEVLRGWADSRVVDVVVSTGGTGMTTRDVTPEATAAVLQREVPGVAEWIRAAGLKQTPYAALSRGMVGTRAQTLIVNLPGSPSGVADGLAVLSKVVDHAAELLRGDTCHGPDVGGG